jgi:hypothetical protein
METKSPRQHVTEAMPDAHSGSGEKLFQSTHTNNLSPSSA